MSRYAAREAERLLAIAVVGTFSLGIVFGILIGYAIKAWT